MNEQKHVSFVFPSRQLSGAQENLSTCDKDDFALAQTFRRLHYLLECANNGTVFTDHRNLLFAFHPSSVKHSIGRRKVMKVMWLALYLLSSRYSIKHVPGDFNTKPDTMTLWMRGYHSALPTAQRVARLTIKTGNLFVPTTHDNPADWPSPEQICDVQRSSTKQQNGLKSDDNGLLQKNEKKLILKAADDMKLKLLTVARDGQAKHRGGAATGASLTDFFTWRRIVTDAKGFVANCL